MNRLNEEYSDRVDFFYLNVDGAETRGIMNALAIGNRSTYIILNSDGSEAHRWVGPLPFEGAAFDLEAALGEV